MTQPTPYSDDLIREMVDVGRVRWQLRALIALAEQSPQLTDDELSDRLNAISRAPPRASQGALYGRVPR